MACRLINLQHIKLEANVSDVLSKHWGNQACWELIQPIFHFGGDTGSLFYNWLKFTTISNLRNLHDWKFSHDGLKFTTISNLRNFHNGECYHAVEGPMISMI
jgi:hypothetical protein